MSRTRSLSLETTGRDKVGKEIRDRLGRFNQDRAGPYNDVRLVFSVRNDKGRLLGGLVALGFWEGLFIELLFVDEAVREQGIGSSLMRAAEAEARKRGWRVLYLSTFSFQAPGFYRKLGYRPFGKLSGSPRGHFRTWFTKKLVIAKRKKRK